jgi:hypothetical protein
MNTGQVVRAEADETGIRLRVWIDDDRGQHVAVAELRLGVKTLAAWHREVTDKRNEAAQLQLGVGE